MADVSFAWLSNLAKVTVRARDTSPALVDAVTAALGAAPPVAPNTTVEHAGRVALWLAPGTWRLVGAQGEDGAALAATVQRHMPRDLAAVVDVSDAYAAIRVTGPGARDLLTRGCPLDLHPRAFTAGRCAQSLLAKTDVLLHQRDDAPTYDLQVRASLAAYLWSWLTGTPIEATGILRPPPHNLL